MLDCAEAIVAGASPARRAAAPTTGTDFEAARRPNWLAHTMVYRTSGGIEIDKKPVTITEFQPKERKY